MGKRLAGIVAASIGVGCNFGSPGGNNVPGPGVGDDGSGGSLGLDDGDGGSDAGPTAGGSDGDAASGDPSVADSGDDATPTSTSDASGESATGSSTAAPGSGALIQLSDAPAYDFGAVAVLGSAEHAVTLTNVGDATAVTITASTPPAPFSYAATGTCTGILDPAESCTIVVVFAPTQVGLVAEALTVEWAGGDESVAGLGLTGGGVGSSNNLLANPGGESAGSPPPSWSEIEGSDWHTYDGSLGSPPGTGFGPHAGAQSIFAGAGGNLQTVFVLGQTIDVSAWAATIDASMLHVDASAWIRALAANNNPGRVRISFLDVGNNPFSQAETTTYSGEVWQERALDAPVPAGTRSILYQLRCTKPAGESQCDAYFDDASLTVRYP